MYHLDSIRLRVCHLLDLLWCLACKEKKHFGNVCFQLKIASRYFEIRDSPRHPSCRPVQSCLFDPHSDGWKGFVPSMDRMVSSRFQCSFPCLQPHRGVQEFSTNDSACEDVFAVRTKPLPSLPQKTSSFWGALRPGKSAILVPWLRLSLTWKGARSSGRSMERDYQSHLCLEGFFPRCHSRFFWIFAVSQSRIFQNPCEIEISWMPVREG